MSGRNSTRSTGLSEASSLSAEKGPGGRGGAGASLAAERRGPSERAPPRPQPRSLFALHVCLVGARSGQRRREGSVRVRMGQMSAAVNFSLCHLKLLSREGPLGTSAVDKRERGRRRKPPRRKDQAQSCLRSRAARELHDEIFMGPSARPPGRGWLPGAAAVTGDHGGGPGRRALGPDVDKRDPHLPFVRVPRQGTACASPVRQPKTQRGRERGWPTGSRRRPCAGRGTERHTGPRGFVPTVAGDTLLMVLTLKMEEVQLAA